MRYADRIADRKPVFSKPAFSPASRFLTAEPYRGICYSIAPRLTGYILYCNYDTIAIADTVAELEQAAAEHFETLKPTIR